VRLPLLRAPAEHRGVVDDRAALAREHVRQHRSRHAEGAVERHVQYFEPLLVGGLDDRRMAAEAGVVHQHVEVAELGDRGLHQRLHLRFVGDVA
jgi:hypothetical protein